MAPTTGQPTPPDDQHGVIINELLCFVTNKCDILPEDTLTRLCVDSYSEEEIEAAKKVLHDVSDKTSRYKKRQGLDKAKHTMSDILKLLRERGHAIPKFVAHDLSKLPPITFDSIDVTVLLNAIRNTQTEVKLLKSAINTSTENTSTLTESLRKINGRVDTLESSHFNPKSPSLAEIMKEQALDKSSNPDQSLWHVDSQTQVKSTTRKHMQDKTKATAPKTKFKGVVGTVKAAAEDSNSLIRAIKPRTKLRFANVFATRFEPDVTTDSIEEYLKKHLTELRELKVEKVKTKFNTYASFHITAKCQDPAVFMNGDIWPKDIFVRWWKDHKETKSASGGSSGRVEASHATITVDKKDENMNYDAPDNVDSVLQNNRFFPLDGIAVDDSSLDGIAEDGGHETLLKTDINSG